MLDHLEIPIRMRISVAKPKELASMLMAYTTTGKINDSTLKYFESEFKSKFEEMNAEDISKYYYCLTHLGFKGEGTFYRYL